jgi:glucose-1-phosphate adenylyltransferase
MKPRKKNSAIASWAFRDIGIGENSVIERAIIDKDCRIGRNVRIVNEAGLQDLEGPNYVIRDGIIVIPKGVAIPDNTVI